MKHFILMTLLLIASSSAFAQYDDEYYYSGNSYQSSYHSHYSSYDKGWWGSIYAGYAPLKLTSTAKGVDDKAFNAVTIGVSFDYQLGNSPLCFEGAFETSGAWFTKRYKNGEKYDMTLYYSAIPINLAFQLNITDGFAIVPFGGVNVKWNVYGEEREKDEYGNTDTWKLFDDYETYDNDYNRFQIGYQAGLRVVIGNCFSIGASWTSDITPLCKYYDSYTKKEEKEKFQGLSFSLGYCF